MPIILHHHERYAGHGYPYGLRANEIPLGARIVAIADAYDAMTHDRPYKRAMSHDAAIIELKQHAGTQFDPELVTLFCDLYTDIAPTPDPTVLAITNPPDTKASVRRDRRVRALEADSATATFDAGGVIDITSTRRDPATPVRPSPPIPCPTSGRPPPADGTSGRPAMTRGCSAIAPAVLAVQLDSMRSRSRCRARSRAGAPDGIAPILLAAATRARCATHAM